MLESLTDVISNKALYSLRSEWPEQDKLRFQRGLPALVFATLLDSTTEALDIVQAQPPLVGVKGHTEDGR